MRPSITCRARRPLAPNNLAAHTNLAVILSRYSADQPTVVAGVLHLVLEETRPEHRAGMEQSIGIKFGSVALAIARDAVETRFDARGTELPWRAVKHGYLAHLGVAEPRAVDICVADEIHNAGLTLTALRRLGAEYVRTVSSASSEQTIWWYRSLLELLEERSDWQRPEMLAELRALSTDVVRALRAHED